MNTTIPRKPDNKRQVTITEDIELAACCRADDRCPPKIHVAAFQDGDRRRYKFQFETNRRVKEIFAQWDAIEKTGYAGAPDPIAAIHRAFKYHARLVEAIRRGVNQLRPAADPPGCTWTNNTKIAAAALALMPATDLLPIDRLQRMIHTDRRDCGFYLRNPQGAELATAFALPAEYIPAHPDATISYLVAAFHHRERLRDFLNGVPAYHIFREGEDWYFIPETELNQKDRFLCPK